MVTKKTAFEASDGSLHHDWYAAAAVSAVPLMKSLLSEEQAISPDVIAARMAQRFFVDRDEEAIKAFAALQDLLDAEPQHENVVPLKPDETTGVGRTMFPRFMRSGK